jgi:hypothetical protein
MRMGGLLFAAVFFPDKNGFEHFYQDLAYGFKNGHGTKLRIAKQMG